MALHTRRTLLLGVAGLLGGLAGCEETGGETATVPAGPTDPGQRRDPGETGVRDPDRYVLRSRDGPLAWFAEDAGVSSTDEGTDDRGTVPAHERRTEGAVTDESTAATLAFADIESTGGARAFVDATDFDRETVYLHHSPVAACERLRLCSVSWADEEVSVRYVQFLKDWDDSCETGETDVQATLVRLPVALDPDVRPGSTTWRRSRRCVGSPAGTTPSDRPGDEAARTANGDADDPPGGADR